MGKTETNILISIKKGKVYCEINGNREGLIDALATLLSDPEQERNSFRTLVKEAMDVISLELMEAIRQEERLSEYNRNDSTPIN